MLRKLIRELPLIVVCSFLVYTYTYQYRPIKANELRKEQKMAATLTLSSANFKNNDRIPAKFTCEGADVSPQLSWSGIPEGTLSIAIICDDPDAPGKTWVHWVIYDIPPTITEFNEGVSTNPILNNGARQGTNDFGKIGYGGPCPPTGHGNHRYFFKIYALDKALNLEPGVTKQDVETAMQGHILGHGELVGIYSR